MNIRHPLPSISRWLLSIGPLMLAAGLPQPAHASDVDLSKFKRIERGTPGPPPATARNHGASGARTRAHAVAIWTATNK